MSAKGSCFVWKYQTFWCVCVCRILFPSEKRQQLGAISDSCHSSDFFFPRNPTAFLLKLSAASLTHVLHSGDTFMRLPLLFTNHRSLSLSVTLSFSILLTRISLSLSLSLSPFPLWEMKLVSPPLEILLGLIPVYGLDRELS